MRLGRSVVRNPGEQPRRLAWCFSGTLYVDIVPLEVSSLLEFFPVCRERMLSLDNKSRRPQHANLRRLTWMARELARSSLRASAGRQLAPITRHIDALQRPRLLAHTEKSRTPCAPIGQALGSARAEVNRRSNQVPVSGHGERTPGRARADRFTGRACGALPRPHRPDRRAGLAATSLSQVSGLAPVTRT